MAHIVFADSALCNGQTATWDRLLPLDELQPVIGHFVEAGVSCVDALDPATVSDCVNILREDPSFRLKLIAERLPETAVAVWTACRSLFGDRPCSGDFATATYKSLRESGATRHYFHDPFNDVDNLKVTHSRTLEAGLESCPVLAFTGSPVHDDAYYEARAKTLAALSPAAVCLYDPGGLLEPERSRTLLPRLAAALDDVALELRSAARSGQAERIYFEAATAKLVDILHIAPQPLAGGFSSPSLAYLLVHLRREGHRDSINLEAYSRLEDYFAGMARLNRFSLGRHSLPEWGFSEHQLTDRLISQIGDALSRQGAVASIEDAVGEASRIREELGYPAMLPPLDAAIARQALVNAAAEQRYTTIDEVIARYALGQEGEAAHVISPELAEKALSVSLSCPLETVPANGKDMILAQFPATPAAKVREAYANTKERTERAMSRNPFEFLITQLHQRQVRRLVIKKDGFSFSLGSALS